MEFPAGAIALPESFAEWQQLDDVQHGALLAQLGSELKVDVSASALASVAFAQTVVDADAGGLVPLRLLEAVYSPTLSPDAQVAALDLACAVAPAKLAAVRAMLLATGFAAAAADGEQSRGR